ncbi:type-F conjugative transfer system secretin TraK [Photobacterium damselae]|uniref:type-F conjugative transfer system secretin TraK n=1 Tax=Photobacterium damselae TaxID=38293 RepID=UPI00406898C9
MRQHALMGLLTLTLTHSAFAAQPLTIPFSDNETLSLNLSSLDINRLVVQDDRITSITCPTGFCTMPAGNEEGVMAPVDPQGAGLVGINVQEPFTLYITTEKGRSFGAFVRPLAVPAITTVFVSTERNTEQAAEFEKQAPYAQTIATLIRHMVLDTTPEGYIRAPITVKQSKIQAKLITTPVISYQGESLTGVTYRVSNKTAQHLPVSPTSFYQQGVKAVSFSSESIPPHSSIYMYQVVGK